MIAKVAEFVSGADLPAATAAGAVAGLAFVAEMALELRLLDHETDDLRLLGGTFVRDRKAARGLGLLLYLGASVNLGILYAALARDRLPGPPWLRGVLFANAENAALYPLALLENRHPAIKRGELDRYWHPVAFLQSIPRHVAYGVVLGTLDDRLRAAR